jgi:hypothetical protein
MSGRLGLRQRRSWLGCFGHTSFGCGTCLLQTFQVRIEALTQNDATAPDVSLARLVDNAFHDALRDQDVEGAPAAGNVFAGEIYG